jgi:hypothetical protein
MPARNPASSDQPSAVSGRKNDPSPKAAALMPALFALDRHFSSHFVAIRTGGYRGAGLRDRGPRVRLGALRSPGDATHRAWVGVRGETPSERAACLARLRDALREAFD